jgi:hypothetical protein
MEGGIGLEDAAQLDQLDECIGGFDCWMAAVQPPPSSALHISSLLEILPESVFVIIH